MTRPATRTVDPQLDRSAWATCASRAAHPSAQPSARTTVDDPAGLLTSIAAGLAEVAVPVELTGTSLDDISRELLLVTPAYEVWLMGWPAGSGVEPHAHDGLTAIAVVSGELVEVTPGRGRQVLRTGAVVALAPGEHHALRQHGLAPATTVHVHQR